MISISHNVYSNQINTSCMNKTTIALAIVLILSIACTFIVTHAYANKHQIHLRVDRDINLKEAGTYHIDYGIETVFIDPDVIR